MSKLTSKQKRALRTNMTGYAFILPNLIGYSLFVFVPVIFSFVLSVMSWDGSQRPMQFVGLQNFTEVFGDRVFRGALVHTLSYALMTVLPTLVLALLLAVLLNNKIKGAVWNMLFQPDFGPVNEFLKFIGISEPPRWVVDKDWAMVAVSIVSVWKYMGYYMIVYLAALQGISSSLYEAASIDGANGFQKLLYITVPMLTPTTFFVLIMLTIQCFKVFDLVYVMTGGGPGNATKTLVNFIYEKAFTSWEFGPASAGAIVLFAIVLLITLIQFSGEKKWSKDL